MQSEGYATLPGSFLELFEEIQAPKLREWAKFLDLDVVRPGDVLLSRGRDRFSWLIAIATGGLYSHAAVFLPFRYSRGSLDSADAADFGCIDLDSTDLILVESDDHGVGKTFLRQLSIKDGANVHPNLARLPDGYKTAILLRHPELARVDKGVIEQAVMIFNDTELLRHYSSWDRLAGPLRIPVPSVQRFIGQKLTNYLGEPTGPVLPGCFCSELVAKFFQQIDIPIFEKAISPENISPNDLRSRRSRLKVVPNAFLTARDIPDSAVGRVPKCDVLRLELRGRHLHGQIRTRAAEEILGREHDEVNERAMETIRRLEQMKEIFAEMIKTFRESLQDQQRPIEQDRSDK